MVEFVTFGLKGGFALCGLGAGVVGWFMKSRARDPLGPTQVHRLKRLAVVFQVAMVGAMLLLLVMSQWDGFRDGIRPDHGPVHFIALAAGYGFVLLIFILCYGAAQVPLRILRTSSTDKLVAESYRRVLTSHPFLLESEELKSKAFLEAALDDCPPDAVLLSEFGLASDLMGLSGLAEKYFERAAACADGHTVGALWCYRAACLLRREDLQGALVHLRRFVRTLEDRYWQGQ